MAVVRKNIDKGGARKRTTIDPRIGGTKGDAGFAGKAGSKGPGTLGGSRGRTKIDPRIGGQKGDAGFSGKATPLSGFGKAFSIALAKGPNTLFTYKGKQYRARKKHEGKGPSASRVEDKVTKGTMLKGRPEGKNPPKKTYTVDGKKVVALSRKEAIDKVKSKKTTPASGRFGQRKAGGIMKAAVGKSTDKFKDVLKKAKDMAGEDRLTVQDLKEAGKLLGYIVSKDPRKDTTFKDPRKGTTGGKNPLSPSKKRRGGVMKANTGKMADKDYDGDGRIESSTAEYMGSRDKAIKQSKKLRGGGAAVRGMGFKGQF